MCKGTGVEVADGLRQREGQGTAPALSFLGVVQEGRCVRRQGRAGC